MSLVTSFDPGMEAFIPYAKKKIRELHEYMVYSGVASFNKRVDVNDGTAIYLSSFSLGNGQYKDRIRITGGNSWVAMDPVTAWWGLDHPAAVLPATRTAVTHEEIAGPGGPYLFTEPTEIWNPTTSDIIDVQHFFLERPWTYTRTLPAGFVLTEGLVVPSSLKFPDGYTVPEGVISDGVLNSNLTLPAGVTVGVRVDTEYTLRHTLVLARCCKRVAEYTWDEVAVFDPAFVPPDDGLIDTATYSTTGVTLGYGTTYVDLVDLLSDGNETEVNQRSVAHGLLAAALANPWGWCGEGGVPPLPTWPSVDSYLFQWPYTPTYNPAGIAAYLNACKAILEFVAPLIDERVTADAAEIMPLLNVPYLDQAVPVGATTPYAGQPAVYIFPTRKTGTVRLAFSTGITNIEFSLSCNAALRLALFRSSFMGGFAGAGLFNADWRIAPEAQTAITPPPYTVEFLDPVKYVLNPTTKTYSLVEAGDPPWLPPVTKAYFSSGIDPTVLEATTAGAYHQPVAYSGGEVSWGAMYYVKTNAYSRNFFNTTLGKGDDPEVPARYVDPAARMKAMCVGQPSFSDLSYVSYSARFTKRGAAYRKEAHVHTLNGYTVVQEAIPNSDAP